MRKVRVRWHTTEVTDYDRTFEIPDDVDLDDLNFWDGDSPVLIEYEDQERKVHGQCFNQFTRETDDVEVFE